MKPIPIDKRCKVCHTTKLLNEFEINKRAKDRHENICKSCKEETVTCVDCIDDKIIDAAFPMIHLLITLVKDGVELPRGLLDQIVGLAYLAGMKCYCDDCGKKI
jgi:hypothetical protein